MNDKIFLILILILSVGLPLFFNISKYMKKQEGYSNLTLESSVGKLLASEEDVLVQDTYPITGINGISNNGSNDIWWHYPIFELGSYKQITNNVRYPHNPDEGTCMPASMCGALYRNKKVGSNVITPLPPVNPTCGTRIGYFSTKQHLLPFRSNFQNILY
jgi:hypothetical protein